MKERIGRRLTGKIGWCTRFPQSPMVVIGKARCLDTFKYSDPLIR